MPAANRDPRAEYLAGHIPGAVFFDIDGVADLTTDLPHMLPTPDEFARMVGALGIGDGMTIVVYDELGLQSAPRVYWTFRTMGATDVRILEGGGAKWRAEGRPIEAGAASRAPATFTAHFDPAAVADVDAGESHRATAAARPSSTPALARASPAKRPSPAPASAAATCRAPSTCPFGTLVENGMLKPEAELREDLRRGRRRSAQADRHQLRLRPDRRDRRAGASADRREGRGGLRRLVDRMGRPRRHAGREGLDGTSRVDQLAARLG